MALITNQTLHSQYLSASVAEHASMALRKIGAEAFIIESDLMELIDRGQYPSRIDIEPLSHHLNSLCWELDQRVKSEYHIFELRGLSAFAVRTREWLGDMGNQISFNDLREMTTNYFREFRNWFNQANIQLSESLTGSFYKAISLIEFDSEFSGVSNLLTEQIINLEKELLIDPNLNQPQEGFGRIEEKDEILAALRMRESRLYALMNERNLEGFFTQVLNPDSVRHHNQAVCEELARLGLLSEEQRIGSCPITGIKRSTRWKSAREHFDLYHQIDASMVATAKSEGIDLLFGLVREGANANTSSHSHRRMGWRTTPGIVMGADGVTPYRIIIRELTYPDGKPKRLQLGLNSHFKLNENHPLLRSAGIENAAYLNASAAVQQCHNFFNSHETFATIDAVYGAHGFYINVCEQNLPYIHYSLQQMRPRTDYWTYFRDGPNVIGALSDLLPLIKRDMSPSIYGSYDD